MPKKEKVSIKGEVFLFLKKFTLFTGLNKKRGSKTTPIPPHTSSNGTRPYPVSCRLPELCSWFCLRIGGPGLRLVRGPFP